MSQPTRDQLFDLIRRMTKQASLPPSMKKSRFVRIPADLMIEAHTFVHDEMEAIGGLEKVIATEGSA